MRATLFSILLVWFVGCNRDREPLPIERPLQRVECTLLWSYGITWFQEQAAKFDGRRTSVILAFYREVGVPEEIEGDITAPIQAFRLVSEKKSSDEWISLSGDPLYDTTFTIDFPGPTIDQLVYSFFDEAGRQRLKMLDDIWLHFVAHEPGSPVSMNMGLTAAGYEEDLGECRLVW